MKNKFGLIAVFLMAILVVASSATLSGCGGGGTTGTSASASATTAGDLTFIRVEAVSHGTSSLVDLGSLISGDVVDLRLVGFDDSRTKHVIPGATFGTSASNTSVRISGTTLTALSSTAGSTFTVSGLTSKYSGNADLNVVDSTGTVAVGRVRSTLGEGVYRVIVKFYQGVTLKTTTHTVSNGQFRVAIPTSVNRFTIDLDEADSVSSDGTFRYYRQFGFGEFDYTANDARCLAPTPTIHTGTNSFADVVPYTFGTGSPPPPPTGCF